MDIDNNCIVPSSKHKINSTGLRLFLILQFLMQKRYSKSELCELINLKYPNLNINPDIIRLDINTLKSAGFDIEIGHKGNNYKYVLNWNPLKIKFTKSEVDIVNQAKKSIMDLCDWRLIINLFEIFKKIAKYIEDENIMEEFLNFGYFQDVDFNILNKLKTACDRGYKVKIVYSGTQGDRVIEAYSYKITHQKDNNKLYFWCFTDIFENQDLIYLRLDKIKEIVQATKPKTKKIYEPKLCKYVLNKKLLPYYLPDEVEKIIDSNENYIVIESEILTEFYFIQKILNFGSACVWVEDQELREKIIEKLKSIRNIYK
ncbi:WYL domain-containing protein [bacterium]|nr:WYL domain-containing protein [bacterium]